MKSPKEWKIEKPVTLKNVPDQVIEAIQANAYNQCLLDLKHDSLLPDAKQNLIKYWKDEN